MRKVSLTLILLLIFYSISYSQQLQKKDTKIIVVSADTSNLFNRIILALFERGYSIESKDEQLKLLASTERAWGSRSVKIRAMIKDSVIIFTGQVANNVTISLWGAKAERTFDNIYYGGMKGSDLRIAWEELDSFAKEFGSDLKYSK